MSKVALEEAVQRVRAASERFHARTRTIRQQLERATVTVVSPDTTVRLVMNSRCEVVELWIDPDAHDKRDTTELAELLHAAYEQARRTADELPARLLANEFEKETSRSGGRWVDRG